VADYTKEDFSKSGAVYDMVFDTVGKSGYSRSLRSLKRGGRYVQSEAPEAWGRFSSGSSANCGLPSRGGPRS